MKNYFKNLLVLFLGFSTPIGVFAAPDDFKDLIKMTTDIVSDLTLVIGGAALLLFFWGVAESILASGRGDKTAAEDGKKRMFWGVVGLFVMLSIWGLINLLVVSFGLEGSLGPTL